MRDGDATQAVSLEGYVKDFDPAIATEAAEILTQWTGRPHRAAPQPLAAPGVTLAMVTSLRGKALRELLLSGVVDRLPFAFRKLQVVGRSARFRDEPERLARALQAAAAGRSVALSLVGNGLAGTAGTAAALVPMGATPAVPAGVTARIAVVPATVVLLE